LARTREHSSGLIQLMPMRDAPRERCVIFTNRISRQLPPASRIEFVLPAMQETWDGGATSSNFATLPSRPFAVVPAAIATMTCCQPGVFQIAYAAAVRQIMMKRRRQLHRARAMFLN